MRTPAQIIGHDAVTQLAFEGYKIVAITELSIGDDVAEKRSKRWRGIVTDIRLINGGVGAPGIATVESGRSDPEQWNLTRLCKTERPEFVTWPVPQDLSEGQGDDT